MENKIKFICNAVKWFDKVNGNTYHSVRVIRCSDGKVIAGQFQYGYGEQYKTTALNLMWEKGFICWNSSDLYAYERKNNYPIEWIVSDGLKRECVANGII